MISRQTGKDVHVISNTTNHVRDAAEILNDPRHIRVETITPGDRDTALAIFGAEDDVVMEG